MVRKSWINLKNSSFECIRTWNGVICLRPECLKRPRELIWHFIFLKADNPSSETKMTPDEMMSALQDAEADREKMRKEMDELRWLSYVSQPSKLDIYIWLYNLKIGFNVKSIPHHMQSSNRPERRYQWGRRRWTSRRRRPSSASGSSRRWLWIRATICKGHRRIPEGKRGDWGPKNEHFLPRYRSGKFFTFMLYQDIHPVKWEVTWQRLWGIQGRV